MLRRTLLFPALVLVIPLHSSTGAPAPGAAIRDAA